MLAQLPIELLACRQRREGGAQMTPGVTVEAALAAEALPLSEDGECQHLAAAQRGGRTWVKLRR